MANIHKERGRAIKELKSLLRIFTARADLRGTVGQHRPATVRAADHRFSEHASHQGAAASAAARPGADAGAPAYLFERFRAGLDRFHHSALADLVAQAGRLEILDDRLLPGFLF